MSPSQSGRNSGHNNNSMMFQQSSATSPLPQQPISPSYACHLTEKQSGYSVSSKKKDKSKQQATDEEEDEIIKVYDGNTSLRKRVFRTISVNKICSYLGILVSYQSRNYQCNS